MQSEVKALTNKDVIAYHIRNQLISKIKNRFSTYSYQQVRTSAFEDYDMYAPMNKTVNMDEMIKVIDRTGKVLVLRPDGTIPITRMTALNTEINGSEQRLFYVLDVFRHSDESNANKESTQAGVEFFGNKTPESDAEVIMLAIHTLKDIGFDHFKIEIGHAGFVKELIEQADLTVHELQQLQELIQSKNIADMEPFLKKLAISTELQDALYAIPLLYGNPKEVLEQTKKIIRNEKMQDILNNLVEVMDVLEDYEVTDYITLNLGLINNMYYYTDIIFQGFVENIGKPVLMGGRYDHLGSAFGKDMAAIGFAYEVDFLLYAMKQHKLTEKIKLPVSILLHYESSTRRQALNIANHLREQEFAVITTSNHKNKEKATIQITNEGNYITLNDDLQAFHSFEELTSLLLKQMEAK